ncbi:MAG: uroporphyrinogen-III synthase [Bacteroidetes bacterium]|nr:uroporphyrinogen-III synthase [Bacteroidota bacterium]MBU1720475.1 uroporphyrinogen-III synthase [Bacteroidota bacterium]
MKIKRILVSQPKPETDKNPYLEIAKKHNVTIDFRPFIKVEGVPAKEFRKDKINITEFSAVVFTSRNAVDNYFRICEEMRFTVPDTMKYFCISEATAFYLQKYVVYRKRKIFHGKQKFQDMIDVIKKHKQEKFLLPCSDIHKAEIPKLLTDNKIDFAKAVIYRTVACDLSDLNVTDFDMLVFFSPSGISSLQKNYPDFVQGDIQIGAFGPTTAKAVVDANLRLDVKAPMPQVPSMSMALDQHLKKANKK